MPEQTEKSTGWSGGGPIRPAGFATKQRSVVMQMTWAGGNAFENLHDQALDKAIIGYYEGSSGTILTGTEDVYKCIPAYNLNQNNNLGVRADPVPENFCEAR